MKKNITGVLKFRRPAKIALVVSHYNRGITGALEADCLKELKKTGAKEVMVLSAPGAFELPLLCQQAIRKHKPDAVIALGCLIKGDTPHFDFIAQAVANGIMETGLRHHIPVIFGVLTCLNDAQAKKRTKKGAEAARAAVQTLNELHP